MNIRLQPLVQIIPKTGHFSAESACSSGSGAGAGGCAAEVQDEGAAEAATYKDLACFCEKNQVSSLQTIRRSDGPALRTHLMACSENVMHESSKTWDTTFVKRSWMIFRHMAIVVLRSSNSFRFLFRAWYEKILWTSRSEIHEIWGSCEIGFALWNSAT